MRSIALIFLSGVISLPGQQLQERTKLPTFPLPSQWQGRGEAGQRDRLKPTLLHAIQSEFHCTRCAEIGAQSVVLGHLGEGAIAWQGGQGNCGATGNCSFIIFYEDGGKVHSVWTESGWTYAIVKSGTDVPDLVFMSNMSCCSGEANRYSFAHGVFVLTGCDDVEQKENGYVLNPDEVTIKPCG